MRVNASEAAWLVARSDKLIRDMCASGDLPATKVKRVGAPATWEIELEDLDRAMPGPVDARRVRIWEAWIALHRAALNPRETGDAATEYRYIPEPPGTYPVGSSNLPGMFGTRMAAARWLARHGVAADTARRWPGWDELVRLDPEDVLRLALRVYDPANARYTWKLHRCDDAGCVCHELL
ncbi:MAG TPA: hypothetical protein VFN11_14340 [Ktedonobacterales bacterium]|nr:hypothetical protein [Ktedonobacterales bacterium]